MLRTLPRAALVAVTLCAVLAGTAACIGRGRLQDRDLPAADTLLSKASTAMQGVQTVSFSIEADGTVGGLALRRASGTLTKAGDAQGSAQIEQLGATVELEFVVIGSTIYVKGPTGSWQRLPLALAANIYDPSAILDPQRGVAKLLETATEAKTEGRERVGGSDAYRVTARFEFAALAALIPGGADNASGELWLAVDTKRLLQARIKVPGEDNKTTTVTVRFTDFDKPVQIRAPA